VWQGRDNRDRPPYICLEDILRGGDPGDLRVNTAGWILRRISVPKATGAPGATLTGTAALNITAPIPFRSGGTITLPINNINVQDGTITELEGSYRFSPIRFSANGQAFIFTPNASQSFPVSGKVATLTGVINYLGAATSNEGGNTRIVSNPGDVQYFVAADSAEQAALQQELNRMQANLDRYNESWQRGLNPVGQQIKRNRGASTAMDWVQLLMAGGQITGGIMNWVDNAQNRKLAQENWVRQTQKCREQVALLRAWYNGYLREANAAVGTGAFHGPGPGGLY
jgi:hypothetical protein